MKTTSEHSTLSTWTAAARPKTLGAALAPVLVGTGMAVEAGQFHAPSALLALLGALLVQVGTNFSNDYLDYEQGADTAERKGPLRVTQAGLVSVATMRRATFLTFALAFLAGGYLIYRGGWPVLLIGVCSIAAGVLYTAGRHSLAYLGLADLAVLVFFGPVAVGGTYYVQALALDAPVLLAGMAPGLLATAILLVNNIRDVEEDRAAEKKTLIVRHGRRFGVILYGSCIVAALCVPVVLYLRTGEHAWAMGTLLLLPLVMPMLRRLRRAAADPSALNPLLGATGGVLIV